MNALEFARMGFKDRNIGALTRTSPFVVRRLMKELKPDFRFVMEYGPGDGVITQALLNHLPQEGRVFAVEQNEDFRISLDALTNQRLVVIYGDALNVLRSWNEKEVGIKIDTVISGIPFSLMEEPERWEIVHRTSELLSPGGIFLLYQYLPSVLPALRRRFQRVDVGCAFLNLPPYLIIRAEK